MTKKLKRYSVTIPYHGSTIVEVTASDPLEAFNKAQEEASPWLCHHCAENFTIEDAQEIDDDEAISMASEIGDA